MAIVKTKAEALKAVKKVLDGKVARPKLGSAKEQTKATKGVKAK